MTGIHHREPGLAGAALDSDDVTVEIIPDLIHVHGAVIQMVVKCKTPDRVVLVTILFWRPDSERENLSLQKA